jgi:hypothetical protein
MTQPIASVVRVAATPQQAKIFVALLQAEGIPATIEGDSLADEVAVSRRLLNLNGTRVVVPTPSLERAREILDIVKVDEEELSAQAMAAEQPELLAPRGEKRPPSRWPLAITTFTSVIFLGLWLIQVDANADTRSTSRRFEATETGMREFRVSDGQLMGEYQDRNRNGLYERITTYHKGVETIAVDEQEDGSFERFEERRSDGTVATWLDLDGDGAVDQGVVCDANGKELQRLTWSAGQGFILQAR